MGTKKAAATATATAVPDRKFRLLNDAIDTVLASVLGQYLVSGSPTKHGGMRFLDIESAKTFGFERTRETENGNLLTLSAPVDVKFEERDLSIQKLSQEERQAKLEQLKNAARERVEQGIRSGPNSSELHQVLVRPSSDRGKQKKLFVEVQYVIPTGELVSDEAVLAYVKKHGMNNTNEAVHRILREQIVPMAKGCMDHLVTVIRKEN